MPAERVSSRAPAWVFALVLLHTRRGDRADLYSCTSPVDRGRRERGRVVPPSQFTLTREHGRASERGCGPTTHTCTCGPRPHRAFSLGRIGFPLPWTRPPLMSFRLAPTGTAWPPRRRLKLLVIMAITLATRPPRQLHQLTAGAVCRGPTVAHACTRMDH